MTDNTIKFCEVCGNPREPQQKRFCKACAKKRAWEQQKACIKRQNEKRRRQKEAERLAALLPKPKVKAPPTIAEVMAYAKEHELGHRYGEAVLMMEAERNGID